MKPISSYLRLPHLANCDCSVCWSARQAVSPVHSLSTPCEHCRPSHVYQQDGRWYCQPASFCAKHEPSRRPPKYWHVVQDTGKPVPFVPRWDLFELEG